MNLLCIIWLCRVAVHRPNTTQDSSDNFLSWPLTIQLSLLGCLLEGRDYAEQILCNLVGK